MNEKEKEGEMHVVPTENPSCNICMPFGPHYKLHQATRPEDPAGSGISVSGMNRGVGCTEALWAGDQAPMLSAPLVPFSFTSYLWVMCRETPMVSQW